MNYARKSGMRGSEREEKPAERPGDNFGNLSMHVKKDEGGEHHLNLTTLVQAINERQGSGPHDNRAQEFKKPNPDRFEPGATKDSAKDSKGNEYA